jgi:hypothetical protein
MHRLIGKNSTVGSSQTQSHAPPAFPSGTAFPLQTSNVHIGLAKAWAKHSDLSRCPALYFCRQSVVPALPVLGVRNSGPWPNVGLVSFHHGTISRRIKAEVGEIDRPLVPYLKSPHMTARSCMFVSVWLVRLAGCNHFSCAVYFSLHFQYCLFPLPKRLPRLILFHDGNKSMAITEPRCYHFMYMIDGKTHALHPSPYAY